MDQQLDDLIARARRMDADALETLVERYGRRVFGLLRKLTASPEEAEDLTQETFLRMTRTIADYDHTGRFEAWLFRIAANLARDGARRRRRRGPTISLNGTAPAGEPGAFEFADERAEQPGVNIDRREARERLNEQLARLPELDREILTLRYYGELSFREIADLLGVPLGTALARGHRALQKMKAAFGLERVEP